MIDPASSVRLLEGDCRELLKTLSSDSVDLIFTSPPYADNRKKTYGGIPPEQYVEWFLPTASELKRVLKPSGWLTHEFFREKQTPKDYAEKKRIQAIKNTEAVRAAQDIGELPAVVDSKRKAESLRSFKAFCENYFKEVFYLKWSEDHLRVIEKIERAVLHGGLFALAMPRGSGKALALDTPIPTVLLSDKYYSTEKDQQDQEQCDYLAGQHNERKLEQKTIEMVWKTMGTLEVGDLLLDENGKPSRVEFATEVMEGHDCYEVGFSDGEKIVCDAEHLWHIHDGLGWHTRPTDSLADGFLYLLPQSYPHYNIRHIVSVKPVASVPVRCIQVDSPSKLYLAGHSFVPTHNTVLCQTAVVWAALSGATPFVCLIAASADRAQNLLENIKTWLECNVPLQEDFPEVCFPVKCLERISNRQKGQKYLGQPTRIEWSADKVVLPTIEGSKASGVVITCSGMHGSDIRGQQHARPDGKVERPGLVLIDDPQTTESAWSRSQSQRREAILAGDVLGMAGPGKKIAGLMACTVIRPGDMAHNILDREKHPDWQGERTKLVYCFPTNEKLWEPEHAVRHEEFERIVGTASNLLTWNRSSLTASVNEINDRLNNYTASANFVDLPTRDIVADESLLPSIPVSGILKNHWYDIAYAPELDLCVACADSTGGGPIGSTMYSQNLVQWTHAGPNSTEHVNTRCDTICYSNELRMFVAASTQDAFLGYSFDGVKFRQAAAPHKGFKAVCWSQELRMFVAVAQEGKYRAAYSYNGIDWTFLEIGQNEVWKAVCWARELRLFVAVGIDGVCMYSRDGIVWTIVPKSVSGLSGSLYNVKWSKSLGKLIAVGTSGAFRGAWSEDAEHWTPISNENGLSASNEWVGLCVADELGLMIAVARSGVNRIAYTEDGLTWIPVGIENGVREDIQWRAAVWVKEKQVLACIGYNGSAYVGNDCPAQIMYSFDGKNYLSYSLQTARGISNKYARHDHTHIDREKGKLQDLATVEKTTLVAAINELTSRINALEER